MKLEYSGDFASFNCDSCYYKTTIVVKDEEKNYYFCANCGKRLINESKPVYKMFYKYFPNATLIEEKEWPRTQGIELFAVCEVIKNLEEKIKKLKGGTP